MYVRILLEKGEIEKGNIQKKKLLERIKMITMTNTIIKNDGQKVTIF